MTPDDILTELSALVDLVRTDPERALETIWQVDEETARLYLTIAIPQLALYR